MVKIIKIDKFEVIIENFNNFFLKKTCKTKNKILNLFKNFNYNILNFF